MSSSNSVPSGCTTGPLSNQWRSSAFCDAIAHIVTAPSRGTAAPKLPVGVCRSPKVAGENGKPLSSASRQVLGPIAAGSLAPGRAARTGSFGSNRPGSSPVSRLGKPLELQETSRVPRASCVTVREYAALPARALRIRSVSDGFRTPPRPVGIRWPGPTLGSECR